MKITCEYCNALFNDTLEKCPNCGAVNKNVRRSTPDQPTTIEELEHWYKEKGLPPYEVTRFFIGQNYNKSRAFGIYKDNDNFIVYKNKMNGTRVIRYEGTDELYAVNEIYTKLKQVIIEQQGNNLIEQYRLSRKTNEFNTPNKYEMGYYKFIKNSDIYLYIFSDYSYCWLHYNESLKKWVKIPNYNYSPWKFIDSGALIKDDNFMNTWNIPINYHALKNDDFYNFIKNLLDKEYNWTSDW